MKHMTHLHFYYTIYLLDYTDTTVSTVTQLSHRRLSVLQRCYHTNSPDLIK